MNLRAYLLLALAGLIINTARANEFTLGAGGIYHQAPYKEYNDDVKAIPFAHYESNKIYIRETSLGYILAKDRKNEFSAILSYLPYAFDPSDSDNKALQKLDKREATALAGLAFYHHETWGTLKASLSGDILDKSNGLIGELSYLRVIKLGAIRIIPSAGVTWYDDKLTQYYYGVSDDDAKRSGLSSYQPGASWNPFLGLSLSYSLTPQLTLLTSARYTLMDSQIADSPMADKDHDASVMGGVSWAF